MCSQILVKLFSIKFYENLLSGFWVLACGQLGIAKIIGIFLQLLALNMSKKELVFTNMYIIWLFMSFQIYFEKQPQHMQKIYTNLSVLSNKDGVSVGDVRSAILPSLKGNSLLIDNFLALLPHEKPAER